MRTARHRSVVPDELLQSSEPQQRRETEYHRVDRDEIIAERVDPPACVTILTRPSAVRQTPIIAAETEKTVSAWLKEYSASDGD